ncbi:MAG: insulinase family protein [Candidatus Rhabdochlamydia sp.]
MASKISSSYRSFKVTYTTQLEELSAHLTELEHIPTGAKVLHIACDDPENLFCLSFQTFPSNSKGVPHILEHTVLCGSQKYPVKDPFFAMTRRSLNSFMNALTGSDFTCYPAASQVEKDFYNLLDVYLDAVFHPSLQKESFLQEGHRLELKDINNLESPLIHQGVVFNEMKGALASFESRMWNILCQELLPDLTYAHVSGGTPQEIPHLSYEELLAFHQEFYHPSRCLFFFYGNMPLEKHLDVLEEKALLGAQKLPPLEPIPLQKRFLTPKYLTRSYPQQPSDEGEAIVTFAWLTTRATDQETLLALFLIDALLMENDASLLKMALTQSGLCLTAESFFDPDMSEVPYGIMCKGCDATKVKELETVLFKTLQDIASQEIPLESIESALHQLELSRTEIDADSGPFGLSLFMKSALTLQHGGRPEKALKIHSLFNHLREEIKDPLFLGNLIQKFFMTNTHRICLTMVPDKDLLEKEELLEKEALKTYQQKASLEEKKQIREQMERLKQFQEKLEHQDLECLPEVTLEDVPLLPQPLVLEEKKPLFIFPSFTNGVVYADLIMDIPSLTEEELPWAQLVTMLLGEVGVGDKDYLTWLDEVQSSVGLMSASLSFYPPISSPEALKSSLVIRSKALERNATSMFNLMKELATQAKFHEKERIIELIEQLNFALQQNLSRNSLKYASMAALSHLSLAGYLTEKWHGLSYVKWVQNLAKEAKQNIDPIIGSLERIYDKITSFHNASLVLGCQKTFNTSSIESLFSLPSKPFTPWQNHFVLESPLSKAIPITSAVGFNAEAFKVCTAVHPDAPFLALASQLMEHLVLHPKIREQGGAYGASISYIPLLGHFTFQTYRDPHLKSSLDAFKEAVLRISQKEFSLKELESAKLEMIQSLDAPLAPSARASTAYAYLRQGKTFAHRKAYREALLAATPSQVAKAVKDQLLPRLDSGVVVSLGSQGWLEKETALLQKPLPIISI